MRMRVWWRDIVVGRQRGFNYSAPSLVSKGNDGDLCKAIRISVWKYWTPCYANAAEPQLRLVAFVLLSCSTRLVLNGTRRGFLSARDRESLRREVNQDRTPIRKELVR
jgi:hypothetical protein